MPGLIVFRRRWSVGSDDLVVPGAFLFTIHLIWWVCIWFCYVRPLSGSDSISTKKIVPYISWPKINYYRAFSHANKQETFPDKHGNVCLINMSVKFIHSSSIEMYATIWVMRVYGDLKYRRDRAREKVMWCDVMHNLIGNEWKLLIHCVVVFPFYFRLIILSLSVIYLEYDVSNKPIELLFFYKIGYICILVGTLKYSI